MLLSSRDSDNNQNWLSYYYGLITAIAALALFLLVGFREAIVGYYLLMLLCHHIFFFLLMNGLAPSVLGLEDVWWSREAGAICFNISCITFILLAREIVRLSGNNQYMELSLRIQMVIVLVSLWCSLTMDYYTAIRMATIVVGFTAVAMFVTILAAIYLNFLLAKLYLLCWSSVLLGGIVYAAKTFALLPSNLFTEYAWQSGVAIEAVALSVTIIYRLNLDNKARACAQAETFLMQELALKNWQKYRQVYENSLQGLFTLNENGYFINVNRNLIRLLGVEDKKYLLEDHEERPAFNHYFGDIDNIGECHREFVTILHGFRVSLLRAFYKANPLAVKCFKKAMTSAAALFI